MKKALVPYNGYLGKLDSGEYVGDDGITIYQPIHSSEMSCGHNYLTETGHYTPTGIRKLSNADRKFIDSAYTGNVHYCVECNMGHDADGYDGGFQFVDCDIVCDECIVDYLVNNNGLDHYIDKPNQCIPLVAAEEFAKKKQLVFVERFISGMVDGRGGIYNGDFVNEGQPIEVLKALKDKHPKNTYVFSHDESGQFQTYFSVWKVK